MKLKQLSRGRELLRKVLPLRAGGPVVMWENKTNKQKRVLWHTSNPRAGEAEASESLG